MCSYTDYIRNLQKVLVRDTELEKNKQSDVPITQDAHTLTTVIKEGIAMTNCKLRIATFSNQTLIGDLTTIAGFALYLTPDCSICDRNEVILTAKNEAYPGIPVTNDTIVYAIIVEMSVSPKTIRDAKISSLVNFLNERVAEEKKKKMPSFEHRTTFNLPVFINGQTTEETISNTSIRYSFNVRYGDSADDEYTLSSNAYVNDIDDSVYEIEKELDDAL